MARSGFHKIKDQEKIDFLKGKNPLLTDEEAIMALRIEWAEKIAECYKSRQQPMFGAGFTPEEDAWLDQVVQAIKNKTSPRPPHPDRTIQTALFMSNL